MEKFIDKDNDENFAVSRLFVERKKVVPVGTGEEILTEEVEEGEVRTSTIFSLKDGYGFISYPQTNNLFFHFSFLVETDFNDLREGDMVEFTMGKNERGEPIARNVKLLK